MGLWLALATVVVMSAGCVAPVPPEPARLPEPPPPKILAEEDIRPVEKPSLVILEVNEEPQSDGQTVELVGTVLNRGPGTARNLNVTVHIVDAHGNELAVLPAEVSRVTVEANGTASFRLITVRPPNTVSYHVVAVAQ